LLRLQIEWGADEALEDAPVARLRPAPATPTAPIARVSPPPVLPSGVGTPAERAMAAASQATSLETLRGALAGFDGCALRETATNLVFAAGDATVGVVVIGDPPNADDDRAGTPFAGRNGQLLDTMLASAGLDRTRLLVTSLLPWRPPGGRPATPTEVTLCLPFLQRLIALTAPTLLVLAGAQAVRALIGTRPRSAGGLRRTECRMPGLPQAVPAVLLPFPASALRSAADRKEAWAALRHLRRVLDG
jgi:DNA polymerase